MGLSLCIPTFTGNACDGTMARGKGQLSHQQPSILVGSLCVVNMHTGYILTHPCRLGATPPPPLTQTATCC